MDNYEQLVKALRYCGKKYFTGDECKNCSLFGTGPLCDDKMKLDAAAAIEELQAKVDRLTKENRELAADRPEMEEVNGHWEWKNPNYEQQLPKRGEMAEVVRCKDCVYYHKAHVKLDDGTELDYDSDVVKEYQQKRKENGDPFWDMVCADLGMNVGGRCERDNNQGYAEDKAVFRSETDFCSKAMAKIEVQE